MKTFNPAILQAYFICGSQDLPHSNLFQVVQTALDAGITAYQFRDKGPNSRLSPPQKLAAAKQLRQMCAQAGVPFFIDDDVQLAQKVQADGVHIGQNDQNIHQVIQEVGSQMLIGYSCSNMAEVQAANQIKGINYYGCGPVFTTSSKPDASPVIGLSGLKKLVQAAQRPVVAIGGIQVSDLPAIAQTQASGAAVISLLTQSNDRFAIIQQLLQAGWSTD